MMRARQWMAQSDFARARTVLESYLQDGTADAGAHYLLAYALLRQNDAKGALGEYTKAANLRAPTGEDLRHVAEAYVVLNDLTDAEQWLTRSLQLDQKDPNTWYALGRVRYTQQRFRDAAECFEHTLQLDPKSAKAEDNLGLAYEELNRPSDAIRAYRQAIAWQDADPHPDSEKVREQPLLNLAIVLIHQNQFAEAKTLLQRAVTLAPNDAKIHEQLGRLYLQQSNLAEGEKELLAAISLDASNASMHFFLGQIYRREGKTAQAKGEFAQSSALLGTHSSP